MEFIRRLRQKIGHERVLIPATAVVILDADGRICMHLRNESAEWGLPGGLMDIGETAEESAVREAREETGLEIGDLRLFGVFSGPEFHTEYPGGDQTAPVILAFQAAKYTGELKGGEKSLDVRFFSCTDLPARMNPYHRKFVDGFLEFQKAGTVPILR